MMKKITLLMAFLIMSLGYAQVLVDFETDPYAGSFAYDVQVYGGQTPDTAEFSQQPNPDSNNNASATAARIVTDDAGQGWQNAQLFLDSGDYLDMTGTNKTVSVKIWSNMATSILAKVVDGPSGGGAAGSEVATDASHGGTGWETLQFDFSIPKDCGGNYCGPAFEVYQRILFFPLWTGSGWACDFDGNPTPCQEMTIWVDDIMFTPTLGIDDYKVVNFTTYPNPTQDSWTVKTQSANISSIRVFDVLGKNVLSLSPNRNEAIIDGATLNKGLYFAKIETASGISSLKLIKQ